MSKLDAMEDIKGQASRCVICHDIKGQASSCVICHDWQILRDRPVVVSFVTIGKDIKGQASSCVICHDWQSRILRDRPVVVSYQGVDGWTTASGTAGKLDPDSYFKQSTMELAAGKFINFYNPQDWALRKYWLGNRMKPDDPTYEFTKDHGFERNPLTGWCVELSYPIDRYEIFAFCMESRVRPLGASADVNGVFSTAEQVDLMAPPYEYEEEHPGHSKQFRSCIQVQKHYWQTVLDSFGL